MFNQTKISLRGRHRILLFPLIIVVVLGLNQIGMLSAFQSSPAVEEEKSNSETLKKLKIASMQHELILLLIENKNFDAVELEWEKVLDLRLGGKYEGAIAQSLLAIGYKLSEARQLALAQKILDESLSVVAFSNKDRADIFRFKAFVFKESGDLDAAIKALRQARELEEKP